jgi:hypothetical protein
MFEDLRNLHDLHQGVGTVLSLPTTSVAVAVGVQAAAAAAQYAGHHLTGDYHLQGEDADFKIIIGEAPATDVNDVHITNDLKMAAGATSVVESGVKEGMYKKWANDFPRQPVLTSGLAAPSTANDFQVPAGSLTDQAVVRQRHWLADMASMDNANSILWQPFSV